MSGVPSCSSAPMIARVAMEPRLTTISWRDRNEPRSASVRDGADDGAVAGDGDASRDVETDDADHDQRDADLGPRAVGEQRCEQDGNHQYVAGDPEESHRAHCPQGTHDRPADHRQQLAEGDQRVEGADQQLARAHAQGIQGDDVPGQQLPGDDVEQREPGEVPLRGPQLPRREAIVAVRHGALAYSENGLDSCRIGTALVTRACFLLKRNECRLGHPGFVRRRIREGHRWRLRTDGVAKPSVTLSRSPLGAAIASRSRRGILSCRAGSCAVVDDRASRSPVRRLLRVNGSTSNAPSVNEMRHEMYTGTSDERVDGQRHV